jgi:hypothetical protein
MLSFLCNFYGGMPKDWLETPVRTFFAMYREGQKLQARQYSELARISLVSDNMSIEYYVQLQERYEAIFMPEVALKIPEKPRGRAIESGSEDARKAMQSVARGMKAFLGYGRR